jgi:hypothetical protein
MGIAILRTAHDSQGVFLDAATVSYRTGRNSSISSLGDYLPSLGLTMLYGAAIVAREARIKNNIIARGNSAGRTNTNLKTILKIL